MAAFLAGRKASNDEDSLRFKFDIEFPSTKAKPARIQRKIDLAVSDSI
jgi:hypothetical protein